MKTKFYVIKKSAGYAVKTFSSYEAAKTFANQCCKANGNKNYIVCQLQAGIMVECQ